MWFKTLLCAVLLVGVFSEEHFDQVRTGLTTLCQRNNPNANITEIAASVHGFIDCAKGLVNAKELKKEIEDAKPKGALDEVFKKYCAKTGEMKTCIHNLVDGLSPCMDATAKEHLAESKNGADQLLDFLCYKDGDRIALFIAEHGPECIQSRLNTMRACAESVRSSLPQENTPESISMAYKCGKFDELTTCIAKDLEQCENPTPSNMAEALFKFVRKASPCNTAVPKTN